MFLVQEEIRVKTKEAEVVCFFLVVATQHFWYYGNLQAR